MMLLRATGMLAAPPDAEVTGNPAAWGRLVEEAIAFRRAGGILTLADWAGLSGAEKGALVEAYRVVESERAAAIGIATLGLDAAAAVAAPSDGGQAEGDLAMERALAAVVRAAQRGSVPVEGQP